MVEERRIVVSTADSSARESIAQALRDTCAIRSAPDRHEMFRLFDNGRCDLAFLDIDIVTESNSGGRVSSVDCLDSFWDAAPDLDIVILCPPGKVRQAVEIVRAGACGYLIYPVDRAQVRHLVQSIGEYRELHLKLDTLQDGFWLKEVDHLIKTDSPPMKKAVGAAKSVSQTDSTILITGETGTGKGVLAKVVHQHSPRRDGPYIGVHCGAIPETLIESELFGHERGAFTGAQSRRMGKFELAAGGTIFLDEVGTMSPSAQIKLLKVLQERTIQRVGGETDIPVNVRVIAAANRDLKKLCEQGQFRSDLYYRLNVFPIELPPLRNRTEDIPHIVNVILKRLNDRYPKGVLGLAGTVLRGFRHYGWPGNIRELENVVERAYILETTPYLRNENFPVEIVPYRGKDPVMLVETKGTLAAVRQRTVDEVEGKYLREKLAFYKGRIDRTAAEAGITPRQLHKLMVKHGISRESFLS